MKTIKLELGLKEVGVDQKERTDKDIINQWFIDAAALKFERGMQFKQQRMLMKILDKLEVSEDTLELEDAEYEFLKNTFEEAPFPAGVTKVANRFYDLLGIE